MTTFNSVEEALQVLELSKAEFNEEKVRSVYKKMALKYHPDRNKAPDAEEKFKKISCAHDWLMEEIRNPGCHNKPSYSYQSGSSYHSRPTQAQYKKTERFSFKGRKRYQYSEDFADFSPISLDEELFELSLQIYLSSASSYAELKIEAQGLNLCAKGVEILLKNIEKSKTITSVLAPSGLFNKAQQARLDKHLANNKQKFENQENYISFESKTHIFFPERATKRSLRRKGDFESFLKHSCKTCESITISEAKLPADCIQRLLDVLKSNKALKAVNINSKLFDAKQKQEYIALINHLKKKAGETFNLNLIHRYDPKHTLHTEPKISLAGTGDEEFTQACQKKLADSYLHNRVYSITIESNAKMPPNGAKILLEALEKYSHLTKVNAPKGFFNHNQQMRLDAYLQKNKDRMKKHIEGQVSYEHTTGSCDTYFHDEKALTKIIKAEKSSLTKINFLRMEFSEPCSDKLFNMLLKAYRLEQVLAAQDFFSNAQRARLNEHFLKNKRRKTKYQSNATIWISGLAALFFSIGAGLSLAIGATIVVAALAVAKMAKTIHQNYLKAASDYYPSASSIKTLTDESVRDALFAGMNARKWPGYLAGFANFKLYSGVKNRAYCTGLNAAITGEKKIIKAIKSLRP